MHFKTTMLTATLLGAFLVGSLGGVFFASTKPTIAELSPVHPVSPIFTTGLNIVNQEGKVRATLNLWDGENPALIMGDAHCDRRTSLAVYGKERTGLTLYGEDCKRRVALEVLIGDQPTFVLRDHQDTPRVQILLNRDGSPLIRLFDSKGKSVWEKS